MKRLEEIIFILANQLFPKKVLISDNLNGYFFVETSENSSPRNYRGKENVGSKPATSLDRVGKHSPQTRGTGISSKEVVNNDGVKKEMPTPETSDEEQKEMGNNDSPNNDPSSVENGSKGDEKKKPFKNPLLWQVVGGLGIFAAIIIFFVACFAKKTAVDLPSLMCGGHSTLDQTYILVVDKNGNWKNFHHFHMYIASRVYNVLGPIQDEKEAAAYQAQAVAEVSNLLSSEGILKGAGFGKYKNTFVDYYDEYNRKACGNNPIEGFACLNDKTFKVRVLKVQEIDDDIDDICKTMDGCLMWKNEGLEEEFGIKDGSCVFLTKPSRGNTSRENITKKCPIPNYKVISPEKIEQYKKSGKITEENGQLMLEITVTPQKLSGEKDFSDVYSLVYDIRGVLMTNAEGYPQKMPYSLASKGCAEGMCVGRGGEESSFTQSVNERWPVHRILTYWYSHFFASWSSNGIESCMLYRPNPVNSRNQFNRIQLENGEGYRFFYPNDPDDKGDPADLSKYTLSAEKAGKMKIDPEPQCIASRVIKDSDRFDKMLLRRHKPIEIPAEFAGQIPIEEYTTQDAIDEINQYIHDKVKDVGIGTRSGVVMSGVSLKNYLEKGGPSDDYQESYTLPYILGGVYYNYGVNRHWGIPAYDPMPARREQKIIAPKKGPNGEDIECQPWSALGLDCVGFTYWAQYNGGLAAPWEQTSQSALYYNPKYTTYFSDGENYNDHSKVALPGDIIYQREPKAGGCCIHSMMAANMLYDQNGVLVGLSIIHESGGLSVNNISIQRGYSLSKGEKVNHKRTIGGIFEDGWNDIKYEEREPSSAIEEGATYSAKENEAHVMKGIIDYTPCFERYEGYEEMCNHIEENEFFAGIIKKK